MRPHVLSRVSQTPKARRLSSDQSGPNCGETLERRHTNRSLLADAGPLYLRVAERIRAEILADGGAGKQLPSERTFSERLGVSRVTVRRALATLHAEGWLKATPTKGWFTSSGFLVPNSFTSFTAMGRSHGLTVSARVLTQRVRPADLHEAERLEIEPGAPLFELERLRLLDDVPIAIDVGRLSAFRFSGLDSVDFRSASLYETLDEQYGVSVVTADYLVTASIANQRQSRLLDATVGHPVLAAEQMTFDDQRRPIEWGEATYRGDRFQFRSAYHRDVIALQQSKGSVLAGRPSIVE
jgi:GntR family transcriptional regulator